MNAQNFITLIRIISGVHTSYIYEEYRHADSLTFQQNGSLPAKIDTEMSFAFNITAWLYLKARRDTTPKIIAAPPRHASRLVGFSARQAYRFVYTALPPQTLRKNITRAILSSIYICLLAVALLTRSEEMESPMRA